MSPWRYRCPHGHASLTLYSETVYCEACAETYERDSIQDLAPTESPVTTHTGP